LADTNDKAKIIRIVKTAEILIMLVGAAGLLLAKAGHTQAGIVAMLAAIFLLGVHSTFLGPIKYAILPQHLGKDDVLGGTGLVEAGTYIAILMGTIIAGYISIEMAAIGVLVVAGIGWFAGREVPPAPREGANLEINYNPFTSSWRLISATMHIPRLFLAICAISFFWTIGSVVINSLLKGKISAKYGPASVIAMGACVVLFSTLVRLWTPAPAGQFYDWREFIVQPTAIPVMLSLLAIAITGGMFVVPLYAFLTTTVTKDQTARTVAANNVVNCTAMTIGAAAVIFISSLGVTPEDMLLLVAAMCLVAAWLAQKLHKACD
jgi:MFS family permease